MRSIAIYHLGIKIISRGKGKSAVAAAAYRAGEKILNEYDGLVHDYTRKGGVVYTEILLPSHARSEYLDRTVLWNAVEKIEKAKNSQLAREIELALPVELSQVQNISCVREYVKRHFVEKGMCADVCIHDKDDGNPHAHILLTMRPIDLSGEWSAKSKKEYILDNNGERIRLKSGEYKTRKINIMDWNDQDKAEEWRAAWADVVNIALEKQNITERMDHRSYARQGIEQIPTVHLGVAAFQMEQRGIVAERGSINREIKVSNQLLGQLRVRISKLQVWLKEEMENSTPPTLADVIQDILTRRAQATKPNRYHTTSNPKAVANMLNFLTRNGIMDMAGLDKHFKGMMERQFIILDKLKPIERWLQVVDENINQAGNYLQFRDIYREYKQQKPKKQEAFRNEHHREITLYENAEGYLRRIMNGNNTLSIKDWKAERDKLTIARNKLNREYVTLKDEVKEVEQIRYNVYNILRREAKERQAQRVRDMER